MPDPIDGQATVVYIHGAGPQDGEDDLKIAFDNALFGGPANSVVARYAQVFWEQPLTPDGQPLEPALDAIAESGMPPGEAADEVLALVPRAEGLLEPSDDLPNARELISAWFARADEIQAIESVGAPALPEWLFRKLAARASADVAAYLWQGWRELMQRPVIDRLTSIDDPIVIIAHSLGSILGYEVLCDPQNNFAHRNVRLLVTAGSPLGIGNVVSKLNGNTGPGWLPGQLQAWGNFTDRLDLVPLFGQRLAPVYTPPQPETPTDDMVDNPCPNNHDLPGYLGVQVLRDLVTPYL
jgi:hypothetical protein